MLSLLIGKYNIVIYTDKKTFFKKIIKFIVKFVSKNMKTLIKSGVYSLFGKSKATSWISTDVFLKEANLYVYFVIFKMM